MIGFFRHRFTYQFQPCFARKIVLRMGMFAKLEKPLALAALTVAALMLAVPWCIGFAYLFAWLLYGAGVLPRPPA